MAVTFLSGGFASFSANIFFLRNFDDKGHLPNEHFLNRACIFSGVKVRVFGWGWWLVVFVQSISFDVEKTNKLVNIKTKRYTTEEIIIATNYKLTK